VVLVEGEASNRKITEPSDLAAAEGMLGRCS
jgi:2-C-methyl-D-erythritol 4-phosphate cytidylyltransferase